MFLIMAQAASRLERRETALRQLYEGLMREDERAQATTLTENLATWRSEMDALFGSARYTCCYRYCYSCCCYHDGCTGGLPVIVVSTIITLVLLYCRNYYC
jgi:hypothetical protein